MSATLTGDRELRRVLNILPDRVYRKVVRQMTSKMATPILRAARRNLTAVQSNKARGVLAKKLMKKTKTYKRDGVVFTVIGANVVDGPHAHLVEFGHRMVVGGTVGRLKKLWSASQSKRTGKRGGGRVVGFVAAKPFMRPALDAHEAEAMAIAQKAVYVGVEREAKKLARLASSGATGA